MHNGFPRMLRLKKDPLLFEGRHLERLRSSCWCFLVMDEIEIQKFKKNPLVPVGASFGSAPTTVRSLRAKAPPQRAAADGVGAGKKRLSGGLRTLRSDAASFLPSFLSGSLGLTEWRTGLMPLCPPGFFFTRLQQ